MPAYQGHVVLLLLLAILRSTSAGARNTYCNYVIDSKLINTTADTISCHSTVKCLIETLGRPSTDGERFMAYSAAVHEFCGVFNGDPEQCDKVPFCRGVTLTLEGHPIGERQAVFETALPVVYALINRTAPDVCWPDWLAVLGQPCEASPSADMQHCLRDRSAEPAGCPARCNLLNRTIVLHGSYCNAADCWPAWALGGLCDDALQKHLGDFSSAIGADGFEGRPCMAKPSASCDAQCVHGPCAVAAYLVSNNFTWDVFKGHCRHTTVVDRLLTRAASLFGGTSCSVVKWLDNTTFDDWVLRAKVCQGTYPKPAFINASVMAPSHTAAGKFWSDAWARSVFAQQPGASSNSKHTDFGSILQASLVECPSGYHNLHQALSQPWLSQPLVDALLEPNSTWRVRLEQGVVPFCNAPGLAHDNDMCHLAAKPSELFDATVQAPALAEALLVSNTTMAVLRQYCSQAFVPGSSATKASSIYHTSTVSLTCDKTSEATMRRQLGHQLQRTFLGAVWILFVAAALLGIIGMRLLWWVLRRCQSSSCLSIAADALRQCMCPGPDMYQPATARKVVLGMRSTGKRAVWVRRLVKLSQAAVYCADVGLDIWTLVSLQQNVASFTALARAYGDAANSVDGSYSRQQQLRADHSEALYWWLIIVFIVQYVAGIILTLPPTLATYDIFDYKVLQFNAACCCLTACTCAVVPFLVVFFFVGAWYVVVADVYMLLAMVGVPAKRLPANKLNLPAYTVLRYLCEGILEALPSALISTAAINQQLLSEDINAMQSVVFWLSLIFSLFRIMRELYKLMGLTHQLGACCFSTAIIDIVYHIQPQQAKPAPATGRVVTSTVDTAAHSIHLAAAPHAPSPVRPYTAPAPQGGMTRSSAHHNQGLPVSAGHPQAAQGASSMTSPVNQGGCQGAPAPAPVADTTPSVAAPTSSTAADTTPSSMTNTPCCCKPCPRLSASGYPPVLVVYVYCCLVCLVVFLLLVCSDVVYPWLMASSRRWYEQCVGDGRERRCEWFSAYVPPRFSKQYNLLDLWVFAQQQPGNSQQCALPDLSCSKS